MLALVETCSSLFSLSLLPYLPSMGKVSVIVPSTNKPLGMFVFEGNEILGCFTSEFSFKLFHRCYLLYFLGDNP